MLMLLTIFYFPRCGCLGCVHHSDARPKPSFVASTVQGPSLHLSLRPRDETHVRVFPTGISIHYAEACSLTPSIYLVQSISLSFLSSYPSPSYCSCFNIHTDALIIPSLSISISPTPRPPPLSLSLCLRLLPAARHGRVQVPLRQQERGDGVERPQLLLQVRERGGDAVAR